jgi:hypothetical protein
MSCPTRTATASSCVRRLRTSALGERRLRYADGSERVIRCAECVLLSSVQPTHRRHTLASYPTTTPSARDDVVPPGRSARDDVYHPPTYHQDEPQLLWEVASEHRERAGPVPGTPADLSRLVENARSRRGALSFAVLASQPVVHVLPSQLFLVLARARSRDDTAIETSEKLTPPVCAAGLSEAVRLAYALARSGEWGRNCRCAQPFAQRIQRFCVA